MATEKKEIIIREIQQWKQSRLLPGEYCDFLLALYSQGEGIDEPVKPSMNLKLVFLLFSDIVMLPLTYLVINFTEFPDRLQMFLAFIFLLISYACYRVFSNIKAVKIPVAKLVILGILLIITIDIVQMVTKTPWITPIAISIQLAGWLIAGYKQKDKYLFGAGMIGTIMVIYYVII
ncbi:hypothetical protein ERJ70_11445 [Sediminibacillus dalangtanensis]|uniref:Uncharacterized protein n=1 Tax=Sediminibacillus dalangtanensis TaxID=2729421 RepID=A0ABX7VWI7_9BACI|nr:hypothetical protein [Sediminibacillus dalangtanensis]QTM99853.1 hypothetical protein ERJ70_11445 [Sediminibacillus dalangtanensis]